jgi:DNA helicase II / ATP-dependent DNA helicase PcrA
LGRSARTDKDERRSAAEERRLFYVAMTRAKDRLFLTGAAERFRRGQIRALPASPYRSEIAAELMTNAVSPSRKERVEARQHSLF